MLCEITCSQCGATIWIRGNDEADTNSLNLSESDWHWEEACQHIKDGGEYAITNTEYESFED